MDLETIRQPCDEEPQDDAEMIIVPPLSEEEYEQATSDDGNTAYWWTLPPSWGAVWEFGTEYQIGSGGYVHAPQYGPFLPRRSGGWNLHYRLDPFWWPDWPGIDKLFYLNVCEGFNWAGAWPAQPPMPGTIVRRYWLDTPQGDLVVPLHGSNTNQLCAWLEGYWHYAHEGSEHWTFGLGLNVTELE